MEKKILNRKIILIFIALLLSNLLGAGNYFIKSKISGGELKLYFNSDIKRVTYFSIKAEDNTNKYVYDIHGGVLPTGKGISTHSYKNIESFRIAQNSPTRLRVVIKSKQKALDKHVYEGNVLSIPLTYGKESTLGESPVEKNEPIVKESTAKETIASSRPKVDYSYIKNRYIVVIDAGHGGKDNGASCCKVKRVEKNVALSISHILKERLEDLGYIVYMTRDDDNFVRLSKRTKFANDKRADIFVSVHANAAPNDRLAKIFKGIEIYYLSPAQTKRAKDAAAKENDTMFEDKDYYTTNAYLSLLSREKIIESHKLGLDVSRFMLRNLNEQYDEITNGGVKPANFWVLVGAQMPSVLVETGYITHPQEGTNLLDSHYQKLLAKGIAEGIEQYLSNER
jgi:N-acetylmuramoyl-L-alanine amidase